MEKTIELTCDACGDKFHKRKAEHNRSVKNGQKRNFCSRKCCGKVIGINNIPSESKVWDHLNASNRADELSPFRWHYRNAKQRKREFDVTLEDLKGVWDKQKGRCPYTGWKLKNMENMSVKNQLPKTPDRASLDRIDSSKGYVNGNIQFVSYMAQIAKNVFSDEELRIFCEAVVTKPNK